MCKFLGITRSLIYYHLNKEESKNNLETEELLEEKIKEIFRKSKNSYGSRKIKVELEKQNCKCQPKNGPQLLLKNGPLMVKKYLISFTSFPLGERRLYIFFDHSMLSSILYDFSLDISMIWAL